MNAGAQIKNAYEILNQAYKEMAQLIKDFEAELKKLDFKSLHTDSGIGAENSKSLNNPDRWIFRYITRYYQLESEINERKSAGIGVVYSKDEKPITPKFLMGIMYAKDTPRRKYDYWWLSSMYRADKNLQYYLEEDKLTKAKETDCWYKVSAEGDDFNERWYDSGYLYVTELVEIKDRTEINQLAQKYKIKAKF